jgi:O-antigen ligase
MAALLILAVPASVGGGQALPALQALAALTGAPAPWRWRLQKPPVWAIAVALLLLWLCASSLWSPIHTDQWLRLLLTIGFGVACLAITLALDDTRKLFVLLLWCCGALALLLAVEALFNAPLNGWAQPGQVQWAVFRNPAKGAAILMCMTAPVAAALLGAGLTRTILAVALSIAASWLSLQFDNAANGIAYLVAFAAGFLAFAAPRITILAGGAFAALWALAAPWVLRLVGVNDDLPYSWAARLHIWRFAIDRIADRPVFGWGLDASRTFDETVQLQGQTHPLMPLHPHNVFLQVWLEAGAIGAVLLAVTIALAAWSAAHAADKARRIAAGGTALAALIFAIDNFSFGAWQEWWIASAFLGALALIIAARRDPTARAPTRETQSP